MTTAASPDIETESLRADLFYNIGSQAVLRVAMALCTLYAAREMGPRQFGVWAVLQVLFLYTAQAHLGTANAMMREVPIARSQGRELDAQIIVNATWSFVTLTSIPAALIAGILTMCIYRHEYARLSLVVLGTMWLVLVQLHSVFFHFWSRSFLQFKRLAAISLVQAAGSLPLCLWLVPRFGIAGYLFALAAGFTLVPFVIVFGIPSKPRLGVYLPEWRRLLAMGLPILPGTLILYLNLTVERVALASTMGAVAVGMFAAAAFFFQTGATIWELFVYTWYPRLAARYGRTGSADSVSCVLADIIPGLVWLTSTMQGLAFLAIPPFIRKLLPQYGGSITAAQVLVLAINLYGVAHLLVYPLNIVGRQRRALLIQGSALATKAALIILAAIYANSLLLVSLGCVLACGVYAGLGWSQWRSLSKLPSAHHAGFCWAVPTLILVASWLLTREFVGWQRSVISGTLYFTAVLIGSFIVERRSEFISRVWTWRTAE